PRQGHSIDWAGGGLLAAASTALLLGLVWGGREYAWSSVHVVGALAGSAVLLAAFALAERRAREPILPFDLLRNRTVAASVLGVQNSVPSAAMGSATALTQFSRQIGATLGVTIMGVIVNQGLPRAARGHEQLSHRLPPALRADLANALHPAFFSAAVVCAIVFLVSLVGIREQPPRRGFDDVTVAGDEASPTAARRAAAR